MIQLLLAAAIGLIGAILLGGCSNGDEGITESLLQRNAYLETQLSASQNILTSMALAIVLVSCGLGIFVFNNLTRRKDNHRGRRKQPTED